MNGGPYEVKNNGHNRHDRGKSETTRVKAQSAERRRFPDRKNRTKITDIFLIAKIAVKQNY